MYEKIVKSDLGADVKIIDLRTDTISRPTPEMKEAMYAADVGDDVYGEDPTVLELERRSAELLEKDDAIFVVSGTMANLISMMVHCPHRGSEIIAGDKSHTFLLEQAGASQLAGIQTSAIFTREDGTFDLDELRRKIRKNPDIHEPVTSLIVVENTHNVCGGRLKSPTLILNLDSHLAFLDKEKTYDGIPVWSVLHTKDFSAAKMNINNKNNIRKLAGGIVKSGLHQVVPLSWLEKVHNVAIEHNIPIHMDGARIMNAAVYLKVAPSVLVRDVDSVCFCLSKGLGCPVGSILAGSSEFITKARRIRKVLGGGWRQAGILAAAGLVALDTMIDRLQIDHDRAFRIAKAIHQMKSSIFKVHLSKVQTNILLMYIDESKVDIKELQRRLQAVLETDTVKASVRCSSLKYNCVRFVLYHEITEEDVRLSIKKIQLVIKEYDEKFQI